MGFSLPCTNKGCGKIQEPYLDIKEDKVYCSLCDREIPGITYFVKVQMKALKQFRQRQPKPFAVKCQRCGKEDRPKLVGQDIICTGCDQPLDHLSEPFKIMLREKLRTTDKDV
jgi:ribosomal protein L34E